MDVYHLVFIHCLKIWKNISDRSVWHKTLRPSLFYEIWRDCVCKRESLIMVMVCSGLLSALGHIWWWCTLGSVQREELTWAWLTLDWDWAAPAPMSEDTRLRRAGRVARDPDSLLLLPSPAAGNIYHMSPTSGIRREATDIRQWVRFPFLRPDKLCWSLLCWKVFKSCWGHAYDERMWQVLCCHVEVRGRITARLETYWDNIIRGTSRTS